MTAPSSSTKRIVKHSTIYAIGNLTRQLVGFLMLPIYTRYLTPADYGVVGLLTFAMSIMEPLFGARLGEAMPKYYFQEDEPHRRNAVISTALTITGIVSASTAFALFFIKNDTSALLFGTSEYGLIVGLFGILILTQALEYYGMTFIRIQQKPVLFIFISLSKLVVQLSLNIVFVVWLDFGVMGVVISSVGSSSLFALGLTIYMIIKVGTRFDRSLARAMLTFSWPLWFVGLSTLYIYSANRYYIRLFYSLEDVGLYELATKFASILSILVWHPFNQFWETERFNYYKQGNVQVFGKTFRFLTTILIATALCIGIAADPIIKLMAAPEFHRAYLAVPILTFAFLISILTTFLNFSFLVTEKTRTISYIGYCTVAVVTLFNYVLIPEFGFVGAAVALTIALLVQFVATLRIGRRAFDMGIRLRPLAAQLALAAAVFALSILVFASSTLWLDVVAKCVLMLIALSAFLALLWRTEYGRQQLLLLSTTLRGKFGR